MKLIDKSALLAEIERLVNNYDKALDYEAALEDVRDFINTLEVKEMDLENYNKVKKVLSISFMNFLDDERSENKMCLSNGECFDIEKAFDELDFAKLFRYIEKYLKAQKGEEV